VLAIAMVTSLVFPKKPEAPDSEPDH